MKPSLMVALTKAPPRGKQTARQGLGCFAVRLPEVAVLKISR